MGGIFLSRDFLHNLGVILIFQQPQTFQSQSFREKRQGTLKMLVGLAKSALTLGALSGALVPPGCASRRVRQYEMPGDVPLENMLAFIEAVREQ